MIRLMVLLLSYSLVAGVESVINVYGYQFYYFLLTATAFVMALVCSKSNDEVVVIYGLLQILCIVLYTFSLFPAISWAYGVLYYPTLNYSIVVYCYELFMLSSGIVSVVGLFYNRMFNVDNMHNNVDQGNFQDRANK